MSRSGAMLGLSHFIYGLSFSVISFLKGSAVCTLLRLEVESSFSSSSSKRKKKKKKKQVTFAFSGCFDFLFLSEQCILKYVVTRFHYLRFKENISLYFS